MSQKAMSSASGDGVGRGRGRKPAKQALKEVTKCMENIGLGKKVAMMAEKQECGKIAAAQLPCTTNIFGLHLPDKSVFRYDVSVIAYNARDRVIELDKATRNDYLMNQRKNRCLEIFKFCSRDQFFNEPNQALYYDGQKILYAMVKLEINGDKRKIFKVDGKSVKLDMDGIERIEFSIAEVAENFEISLNDMTRISRDLTINDRSLLQFIDIATSQSVIFNFDRHASFGGGTSYLKKPLEEKFDKRSVPDLAEGKYVAVGAHKSAHTVEGPGGRNACNMALVIDTAKTAFHYEQNVMEKAMEISPNILKPNVAAGDIGLLRKQLKGLFAETRVEKSTIFQITNVTAQSARTVTFDYNAKKVTVEEYYQQRYNLRLKYPGAPMLVSVKGPRTNYFPMEISFMKPFQRVQQSQQTAAQLKGMRQACIIPPVQRIHENDLNVEALDLRSKDNTWIAKSGFEVKRMLNVNARILPAPQIDYKNVTHKIQSNKFEWVLRRDMQFAVPATVKVWALCGITSGRERGISERDLREFGQLFVKTCQSRGMEIYEPADMSFIGGTTNDVEAYVKNASKANCTFILFVQEDVCGLHDFIKEMERQFVIITQDMKMSRVFDILRKHKTQTLDNIICKTNVKLGGLVHGISSSMPGTENWIKKGRLFIGFAMSHSEQTKQTPDTKFGSPSVSAYAANISTDYNFYGDFGFHDPRRTDNVSFCMSFTSRIIKKYLAARGHCPSEVIIYRGGISEGQFAMAHQFEIPLIRQALKESVCGSIPLTFIVANRLHRVRIFPKNVDSRAKPRDQNLPPGSVIDSLMVHPKFNEFYLNSHIALQGCSKTTRYTVLVDDNHFSMDDLEGMTYSLCFCHQIVTVTTSLPSPLYVAGLYADRGRRLLHQASGSESGSSDGRLEKSGPMPIEKANSEIPYEGTKLAEIRINA